MLVHKDGHEEVILPPTPDDELDGSYMLTKLRTLQRTDLDQEDSEIEEDREKIYPEEEYHILLIRRSFHTTPKSKVSNQRENIFQTKCKIQIKIRHTRSSLTFHIFMIIMTIMIIMIMIMI